MSLLQVPPILFRLKPDLSSAPGFDAEIAGVVSFSSSDGSYDRDPSVEFAKLQDSFDSKCVQELKVREESSSTALNDGGREVSNGSYYMDNEMAGQDFYTTPDQYEMSGDIGQTGVGSASYPNDFYNSQEWGGTYGAAVGGTMSVQNAVTNPMEQEMYPPGFYDNRYVSADVTIEGQGQDYFVDGTQQVRRRPEMSRMSSKRALMLAQAGGDDDDDGTDLEDGEMHNGKYPCSLCKKRFGDPASARRHERSHRKRPSGSFRKESKSNTYKCNLCQQRFSAGYTLKKHIRVHTREKPFSCDLCNEKFSQWGNLRLHMQRHLGINPYRCPYCDKAYIAPSKLEVHIRGHTNERPYGCDVCCSNFKSNDDLRKHMMIHCNYKPFTCWICQKSFMQPSKLKQHMKEKHTLDIDVCKKDVTDRGVEYQIKILPNQANSAAAFAAAAAAAAVTAAQKASSGNHVDEAFAAASAASGQGIFDATLIGEPGVFGDLGGNNPQFYPANNSLADLNQFPTRTVYTPTTTVVVEDDDDSSNAKFRPRSPKRAKRSSKHSSVGKRH